MLHTNSLPKLKSKVSTSLSVDIGGTLNVVEQGDAHGSATMNSHLRMSYPDDRVNYTTFRTGLISGSKHDALTELDIGPVERVDNIENHDYISIDGQLVDIPKSCPAAILRLLSPRTLDQSNNDNATTEQQFDSRRQEMRARAKAVRSPARYSKFVGGGEKYPTSTYSLDQGIIATTTTSTASVVEGGGVNNSPPNYNYSGDTDKIHSMATASAIAHSRSHERLAPLRLVDYHQTTTSGSLSIDGVSKSEAAMEGFAVDSSRGNPQRRVRASSAGDASLSNTSAIASQQHYKTKSVFGTPSALATVSDLTLTLQHHRGCRDIAPDNSDHFIAGLPRLFIAHDNPQLANNIAGSAKRAGTSGMSDNNYNDNNNRSSNNNSLGSRMDIMLESKDEAGLTRFLLGSIAFCGEVGDAQAGSHSTAASTAMNLNVTTNEPTVLRGSQCLICDNLRGVKGDLKAFRTRMKDGHGEVIEIDIGNCPSDWNVPLVNSESVREFLGPCKGRVDVILDPYTNKGWYPYFEGTRKMAPQFRSRGIGYIRLGDDMSQYGSAFLSLDFGRSFLDDGVADVVSPLARSSTTPSSFSTTTTPTPMMRSLARKKSAGRLSSGSSGSVGSKSDSISVSDSAKPHQHLSREASGQLVLSPPQDGTGKPVAEAQGFQSQDFGTGTDSVSSDGIGSSDSGVVKELIVFLSVGDSSVSWSDRVDAFKRLQDILSCAISSIGPASIANCMVDLLTLLADNISKQKNPNVIRSVVACIPQVGMVLALLISGSNIVGITKQHSGNSTGQSIDSRTNLLWRSLLISLLQNVRAANKGVADDAYSALLRLHTPLSPSSVAGATGAMDPTAQHSQHGGGAIVAVSLQDLIMLVSESVGQTAALTTSSKSSVTKKAAARNTVSITTSSSSGGGNNAVGVSSSAAVNMFKVFQLLENFAEEELSFLIRALLISVPSLPHLPHPKSFKDGGYTPVNLDSMLMKVEPWLSHRDEATRRAALSCTAHVVLLSVLQTRYAGTATVSSGNGGPSVVSPRVGAEVVVGKLKELTRVLSNNMKYCDHDEVAAGTFGACFKSVLSAAVCESLSLFSSRNEKNASRLSDVTCLLLEKTVDIILNTRLVDGSSSHDHVNIFRAAARTASPRSSVYDTDNMTLNITAPPSRVSVKSRMQLQSQLVNDVVVERGQAAERSNGTAAVLTRKKAGGARDAVMAVRSQQKQHDLENQGTALSSSAEFEELSSGWFEAKLALRKEPKTDYDWSSLVEILRDAEVFFQAIDSVAKATGVSKGEMIRRILPFDESTSSSDQAAAATSSFIAGDKEGHEIGIPRGCGGFEELSARARAIRSVIRIKMSDEADMAQARETVRLLKKVTDQIITCANEKGVSPIGLSRSLN